MNLRLGPDADDLLRRTRVEGQVINLFNRDNFEVMVPDVSQPDGQPVTYQTAPAFPRLFTYGVRFRF